jgi:hypothetical protein
MGFVPGFARTTNLEYGRHTGRGQIIKASTEKQKPPIGKSQEKDNEANRQTQLEDR